MVDTVATRREGIQSLVDAIQGGNLAHPHDDGLVDVPGIQGLPAASPERWLRVREVGEQSDLDDQEVAARYRRAQAVVSGSQSELASTGDARKRREFADGLLLHPLLGPVGFLLVMGATFQAVFALADLPIQWIESAFGNLLTLRGQIEEAEERMADMDTASEEYYELVDLMGGWEQQLEQHEPQKLQLYH